MTGTINAASEFGSQRPERTASFGDDIPVLSIRVFGGFDLRLDGIPIDSPNVRQRKVQTLMGILAINHGHDLYSDHLAQSIWPRSAPAKQKHCFYNLWYLTVHSVYEGPKETNPYFERHQGTCRLLDAHVRTDAQDVERACDDLMAADITPERAIDAYRRLQASYRGDLLPGEMQNPIVIREREDWREQVSDALSAAAMAMVGQGEDRTALWLATVACRLSGLREDMARLRMELFAKMGMQAYAVRAYNELENSLLNEAGMMPSPQSVELIQQVVDAGDLSYVLAAEASKPRRRKPGGKQAVEQRKRREFVYDTVVPETRVRYK